MKRLLFGLVVFLALCGIAIARGGGGSANELKRTMFNLNFLSNGPFWFIDLFQEGAGTFSAHGGSFVAKSSYYDVNGYPCTNQINTSCPNTGSNPVTGSVVLESNLQLPASNIYSGPYCLTGIGSGTVDIQVSSGSLSVPANNTVTCAAFNGGSANNCPSQGGGGNLHTGITVSDETWSGWCIAVNDTGQVWAGGSTTFFHVTNDDPMASGHYVKGLHLYRQTDGADFAAGNLFRTAAKQTVVTLDPSFVRVENWQVPYGAMRWSKRCTPSSCWALSAAVTNSQLAVPGTLPYGQPTAGADRSSYTVTAVTGTPASMQHGEMAYLVFPSAGPGNGTPIGGSNLNSISVSGTTVTVGVTSNSIFATGDTVVFDGLASGQNNLNRFFATNITVDSSTQFHFTFANAASISNCASNSACSCKPSCSGTAIAPANQTASVWEGYRLQVGTGNDRTLYPISNSYPNDYLDRVNPPTAGLDYMFCFNKNAGPATDGSGNVLYGQWIACGASEMPVEYLVAFVNELNAMSPAHPINLWYQTKAGGLICNASIWSDPDCSAADDVPVNVVNTMLNGANGFAGLCKQCLLALEDGDETWDGVPDPAFWLASMGTNPKTSGKLGCSSAGLDTFSTMHTELVMSDIQRATDPVHGGPISQGRVLYMMGGQMGFSGRNQMRWQGAAAGLDISSFCSPGAVVDPPGNMYNGFHVASYTSGSVGAVATLSSLVGGSGYTPGTYTAVATSASGSFFPESAFGFQAGLLLNIVVNGSGVVSDVSISPDNGGRGVYYEVGNIITAPSLPGGSGFQITVASILYDWVALPAQWGSDVNSFGFNSYQAQNDLAAYVPSQVILQPNTAGTIQTFEQQLLPTDLSYLCGASVTNCSTKFIYQYEGNWGDFPNVSGEDWGITSAPSCASGTVTFNVTVTASNSNLTLLSSNPVMVQNVSAAGYNGMYTLTAPNWSSATTYVLSQEVLNPTDSKYYISLANSNLNNRPDLTVGTDWVLVNSGTAGLSNTAPFPGAQLGLTAPAIGGSCPSGTPAINWQGYYGRILPLDQAYLRAVRDSQGFAAAYLQYMQYIQSTPHLGVPGNFIPNGPQWGQMDPDIYGSSTTEAGSASPEWTMMGNFNRSQPN